MNDQKSLQSARTKAKAKIEFKIHLISYLVINTLLAITNLSLTPEYIWFKWPLMGWGIAIILHAVRVYYSGNTSVKDRMIEKEMRKQ